MAEQATTERAATAGQGSDLLHIQVCYAEPAHQVLRDLQVPFGTTIREAILLSGIAAPLADGAGESHRVGIYGKLKTPDAALRDGDRIEIYRPLLIDPKDARRHRADKKTADRARMAGKV